MEDTSREIKQIHQQVWMGFTVGERIRKCAELFEFAKRAIEARLPDDLAEAERKRRVFRELYGFDLPERSSDYGNNLDLGKDPENK
jgi:hypothetical protein